MFRFIYRLSTRSLLTFDHQKYHLLRSNYSSLLHRPPDPLVSSYCHWSSINQLLVIDAATKTKNLFSSSAILRFVKIEVPVSCAISRNAFLLTLRSSTASERTENQESSCHGCFQSSCFLTILLFFTSPLDTTQLPTLSVASPWLTLNCFQRRAHHEIPQNAGASTEWRFVEEIQLIPIPLLPSNSRVALAGGSSFLFHFWLSVSVRSRGRPGTRGPSKDAFPPGPRERTTPASFSSMSPSHPRLPAILHGITWHDDGIPGSPGPLRRNP